MKKVIRLTESELIRIVKKVIAEQNSNQSYKVGQILNATRSTDGKQYQIKVIQLTNDGGSVVVKITGPGTYQGKKLDGVSGSWELNTNIPSELSGNSEMGTFKIKQDEQSN